MSSNNSEGHNASPYDDKHVKGADGTVVNTVSRGDASGSIDGEGFPADVDEKKLMRKIDMRLIPWLCVLYLLSFLDRSAIGNARLYGLEAELGLTSQQYNIALTVFFFPYALFEVPSNVLLKRLRPSIWFPAITILVGICMLSQGLVHNYEGLVVARFFLGITEAGLFPGANYLLSGWYKRSEFGLRAAVFFSAATASGAFGGLLSFAINKMDGIGGYSGWRWIFIIIGLATFVSGVMSFWLVADFPDTASFLSDSERRAVIYRLQQDQQFSAAGEKFKWANVWKAFGDWKTWVGMGAYIGCVGPLYAFSLFTPTIVKSLNPRWSANTANLISIPIYITACIVTVIVGFLADRTSRRTLYSIVLSAVGIIGYIILIANDARRKSGVSYFAVYLAACGIYPMIPNTIAIVAGNSEGAYVRSVVTGVVISFGNINGAVSSNIYPRNTSPRFILGHAVVLAYIAIGLISNAIFYFALQRENRQRDAGKRNETILADDPSMQASGKDLQAEAAQIREREIQQAGALGGLMRRLHLGGGGTYATWEEAKVLKGDQVSTFRYRW
ncbi:Major facilitator superfamily [Kalmanozyma brasiliensis GHG001]|uniref:Major facilitator superfamily n=1 Tax=Kalmanozyma brasiliensis (strain GHG001) TaxID=1365824 RepID=UPI002867DABE|nr:Major facilitator superfamily [Kalmanozyma brasiliensis GHG001]EST05484.2 Major facilitator superfamily [Kalmanozyma brasiliensis GHG001]